ncbi:hypothetical protein TrVFT333_009840 [Trichoderma virens FT-333]|nr:hypothetical protein TrVFT333_009840 [Trichoderma virens FT-333]
MPLASLANILPFLSPSSPRVPKHSPVIQKLTPVISKERPVLRICFPLRIQRGLNSWWEYEEFQIQFRDRQMWRQAFRLDEEDPRETSFDDEVDLSLDELSKRWGNTAAHNSNDPAFKSHWSYSTSSFSSVLDNSLSDASDVSKSSSQRLMELITRLLSATSSTQEDKSSVSIGQVSQPFTSSSSSSKYRSLEQDQPFHPQSVGIPSEHTHSSPDSSMSDEIDSDEIQHHRNIALRKLEGGSSAKTKYMCFSTFRNMFRTHKTSTIERISPVQPTVSSLQSKASLEDQGTIRISSEDWASLRDDILGGLMDVLEGVFPFYTESQKAIIMPVEQTENGFRVQEPTQKEDIPMSGLKAALEHIEARNWKDVIFVSYDDTPRVMRWYTTREPRVLLWGVNMI